MRYLVCLRSAGYARHLQSTMRELCTRGHEVLVALGISADTSKSHDGLLNRLEVELSQLEAEVPGLTVRPSPEARGSAGRDLAGSLRAWLDFLHFLEPPFENSPKLRTRGEQLVPLELREATLEAAESPDLSAALKTLIRTVETMLPVPEPVRTFVEAEQPHAVVVCPLLERRSPQTAFLRAAHMAGIPAGLCVASWDNLTTSSLIHGDPDLVTVWNEAQRTEAVEIHDVPADRVAVTGAPVFDPWFGRTPTMSRSNFCARVGLPDDRPFVLYVCSSGFVAPDEAPWIRQWIAGLRKSGFPELAALPVLIRPHPQNRLLDDSPAAKRLERTADVAIYPPDGELSLFDEVTSTYFDSIHHSAAVVGVNTSAMIESAIAGRAVHVLLGEQYQETQHGLPHYAHLRTAGGGLVHESSSRREHAAGLARAIRGDDAAEIAERNRRFLEAFVRPYGLTEPATPRMVHAFERLAEMAVTPPTHAPGPPTEQLEDLSAVLEPLLGIPGEHRRRARRMRATPGRATSPKSARHKGPRGHATGR